MGCKLDDTQPQVIRVVVASKISHDLLDSVLHSPEVVLADTSRLVENNDYVSFLNACFGCIMPWLDVVGGVDICRNFSSTRLVMV